MRKSKTYLRVVSGVLSLLMTFQSVPVMAALSPETARPVSPYSGQPLPVDVRHGELVLPSEDLKVGIDTLPLAVSRVYRSNLAQMNPGVFGWKWHSMVDVEVNPGVGLLTLVDENGMTREYRQQKDGSFVSTKYDYETIRKRADGGFDRVLKNGTIWHFDATYKLAEITDANGRFLRIERKDQAGEKSIRISDRYGRFITLTLNADGRVVRMMDKAGRMCLYSYDQKQNLVAFQSQAGGRINYSYDQDHRLTELNPGGYRSFFVQYKGDKVAVQKTQLGQTAAYKYEEKKDGTRLVHVTDGADRTTSYEYRADGTVTGTDPTGVKDSIRLNERELPVLAIGADGRRVEVEYDSRANVVAVNNCGEVTRFTYDPATALLDQVVLPSGETTTFAYDKQRNCTSTKNSLGATTKLEWNKGGLLTSVAEPTGRSLKLDYDAYGQVQSMTAGDGQKTAVDFTMIGLLRSVTLPTGVKINYQYDGAGQLATVSNSEGQQAFLIRNEFGQVSRVVDPAGHSSSFDYDPAGMLTSVADPMGAVTKFDYDNAGNMTALTDAKGNVTRWIHDAAGRLQAEIDPLGAEKRIVYDKAGRPAEQSNARGQKSSLSYDSKGLLTAINQPEGVSSLTYDGLGRLTGMKNVHSDYEFSFTKAGLPEKVRDAKTGIVTEYRYDSVGRRIGMKAGTAVDAAYQYDDQGRLSVIKSSMGDVRFEYDAFGRRSALIQPNGTQTKYGYDKLSRVTEQITTSAAGSEICSYRYQYDLLGNRTSMTESGGKVTQYEYDNANRLTCVVQGTNLTSYAYDEVGNRVSVTQNGKTEAYVTGKDNRLITAGAAQFQYDADGNMVSRKTADGKTYAYNYDSENRLVEAAGPDGKVRYDYAPNGGRVARTEGAKAPVRFIFDQADMVAEVQDGKVLAGYLHGPGIDQPLALRRDGQTVAYHADGLGSITRLTDAAGAVVGNYEYDAFGQPLRAESKVANSFTYTGREWDSTADAYFYRARFFVPDIGRFSARDPLGLTQGPNQYAYVFNNPTKYTDPTGEFAWFVTAAIGAAIGGGIDLGVQLWANGGNIGDVDLISVGASAAKGAFVGSGAGIVGLAVATVGGGVIDGSAQLIRNAVNGNDLMEGVVVSAAYGVLEGGVMFGAGKVVKSIISPLRSQIGHSIGRIANPHFWGQVAQEGFRNLSKVVVGAPWKAIKAVVWGDQDKDGNKDWYDPDDDRFSDWDNDGIVNWKDSDYKRDKKQNDDGWPDILDFDDNNNGIPDWADPSSPKYDANKDGIPDNKAPEASFKDDSAPGRKASQDAVTAGSKAMETSVKEGGKAIQDSISKGQQKLGL